MADTSPEPEDTPGPRPELSRRKALTPEQRRLLGTPRTSVRHRHAETAETPPIPPPPAAPASESLPVAPASIVEASPDATAVPSAEKRRHGAARVGETKGSRRVEMQRAFLVIGGLLFLGVIFWAGRKFDHIKYHIMSRVNAQQLETTPEKFPDLTSEELVESALAAEQRGDWQDAADRLIEAKHKDLQYQGIFFRLGKTSFDQGSWENADQALAQALKFGENIAVANHLRGLIAVRRHDYGAAANFFQAAATAEPFVADYFYFWAETLRLNQRPRDAIERYQQAMKRTFSPETLTLCQFKIRVARIEAAEAAKVRSSVEETRKAGPLSLSWLMTDAALRLHAGEVQEAARLISQARAESTAGLFQTYASDNVFRRAAEVHPEIAALLR